MVFSKLLILVTLSLYASQTQLSQSQPMPAISFNEPRAVTITCADTLTSLQSGPSNALLTMNLMHAHVLTVDCSSSSHFIEIGELVPQVDILCAGTKLSGGNTNEACDKFSIISAAKNTRVTCLNEGCMGVQLKCQNRALATGIASEPVDSCIMDCLGDDSCESIGVYCEGEFETGCKVESNGENGAAIVNGGSTNTFGFFTGIPSVIRCQFDPIAQAQQLPTCGAISSNWPLCETMINTNLDCEHINIHCPIFGTCCNGLDCKLEGNPLPKPTSTIPVTQPQATTTAAAATATTVPPQPQVTTTKTVTQTTLPVPTLPATTTTTFPATTTTQIQKMVIPVFEWPAICGRNGILRVPGAEGWVKQFNGLSCTDVIFECHHDTCKLECNAPYACTRVEVRSIGAGVSGGNAINLGGVGGGFGNNGPQMGGGNFGGGNFGGNFGMGMGLGIGGAGMGSGQTTEIQVECKYRNSCVDLLIDSESTKTELQCGKRSACTGAIVNCPTRMDPTNAHEYVCDVINTELMSFANGQLNCDKMVGGRCKLQCQTNQVNVGVMPLGQIMTEEQQLAAAIARASYCYGASQKCPAFGLGVGVIQNQQNSQCLCEGSPQDCPQLASSAKRLQNNQNKKRNRRGGNQNNQNNPNVGGLWGGI